MTTAIHLPEPPYQAEVIVSPMMYGDDQKDQDRARFVAPGLVGIVCDGVTSSPHSQAAAQLVTSFAPILFQGNVRQRLRTICDLLKACREEFQMTRLTMPDDIPEAMRAMLRAVLREKRATSYQTTVVAVRLRPSESGVGVDILLCGDSALLAFSNDGELLYSSLARGAEHERERHHIFISDGWRFGPGDQLLVRVEGPLNNHEGLVARSGISEQHLANWLVCTPVDASSDGKKDGSRRSDALVVTRQDRLLVPRYLYGWQLTSEDQKYRCLDYSSTIRIVTAAPQVILADGFEHRRSATMVLPDHFYCGHYDYIEDRFPCGTHFVACSDGFYSTIASASQMWAWLHENREVLASVQEREPKLRDLHQKLHEKGGDDDMSFVWMYPTSATTLVDAGVAEEQED
jgi:hypothetical protein